MRLELDRDAAEVLDRLTVNSRRKSEVINRLLLAASERQERIDRREVVPADEFTRALMNLSYLREQFGERKAKREQEDV